MSGMQPQPSLYHITVMPIPPPGAPSDGPTDGPHLLVFHDLHSFTGMARLLARNGIPYYSWSSGGVWEMRLTEMTWIRLCLNTPLHHGIRYCRWEGVVMSDHKHLVYAILHFLNEQRETGALKEDAIESLEVATQCLETAYEVSLHDETAASHYILPAPLTEVFTQGLTYYGQKVAVVQAVAPTLADVSSADKDQAEKHKAEGNEFMKLKQFAEALVCYTKAIDIDPSNAVYYCNRAAAHSKLNNNDEAIGDCKTALDIDPNYSKAYGRKGLAHSAQNEHQEAIECYKRALELDPDNPSYKQNLDIAEKKAGPAGMPSMPGMPGGMGGLNLGGLDFTSMMSNPALMNMATNMMQNPQMQQLMANLMSGGGGPGAGPEGSAGMANLLQAGQQLAQQMQQTNPDLVEQLREQMGPGGPSNPNERPDVGPDGGPEDSPQSN